MPVARRKRREHQAMIEFVVSGLTTFPLDMLRLDICYPKTEEDSAKMERSFQPRNFEELEVTMLSNKMPTSERWKSFGWRVNGVHHSR
jgi:hypothetical protein